MTKIIYYQKAKLMELCFAEKLNSDDYNKCINKNK